MNFEFRGWRGLVGDGRGVGSYRYRDKPRPAVNICPLLNREAIIENFIIPPLRIGCWPQRSESFLNVTFPISWGELLFAGEWGGGGVYSVQFTAYILKGMLGNETLGIELFDTGKGSTLWFKLRFFFSLVLSTNLVEIRINDKCAYNYISLFLAILHKGIN